VDVDGQERQRTQKEDNGPQCRGGDAVTSGPSWRITVFQVDIRPCVFDCVYACMWSITVKGRIRDLIRQVKL